jgi:endonuclease/exonuclease/phosphatase family metal-dependent hydrolase
VYEHDRPEEDLMARLDVFLFNYESGGRQSDGSYDLEPLGRTVAQATPHVLVLNEAAGYGYRGSEQLYRAANTVTHYTGKVFVPLLGWTDRGDYPPAVFYQPEYVQVDQHFGTHPDDPVHLRNLVAVTLRADGARLQLLPIHFDNQSGAKRFLEAEEISWAANPGYQTIVAGDFNSTSCGTREASADFARHPLHQRTHKARWVPHDDPHRGEPLREDTRALDRLLDHGLYDVADLAYNQGTPQERAYTPTVNEGIDAHGPLRIDRILVSEPLANSLIPDTYAVWIPEGATRADYPSDHRAVSASFDVRPQ